jgi:hypothetical protein
MKASRSWVLATQPHRTRTSLDGEGVWRYVDPRFSLHCIPVISKTDWMGEEYEVHLMMYQENPNKDGCLRPLAL